MCVGSRISTARLLAQDDIAATPVPRGVIDASAYGTYTISRLRRFFDDPGQSKQARRSWWSVCEPGNVPRGILQTERMGDVARS